MSRVYTRVPLEVRFWRYVEPSTPDECWIWKGSPGCGYGQIAGFLPDGRKQSLRANRVSWEIHHGPIPEGLEVCHSCDTPLCVNPAHLFLGTHRENLRDMARKGRTGRRLLTDAQVLVARRENAAGVSLRELARRLGIDRKTLTYAIRGRTFAHLSEETI